MKKMIAAFGAFLLSSASLAHAETTLTWLMWGNTDAETAVWQHLADMVHEKHPDIVVKVQTAAWLDYWTKLPTLAAGNQLPDIVGLQSLRTTELSSILEPLDAYVAKAKFAVVDFQPSIIDGLKTEGALYALPYDLGPWLLFYNKDMFQKKDVPLPKPGWTKAEFLDAAQKLTANGNYGFATTSNEWLPFMLSAGANYIKDDAFDLTNDKLVNAFQAYADLAAKDKIAPQIPASGTASGIVAVGRFTSGSLGMMVDGPWDLVNVKGTAKFNIGFATIPADTAGSVTQVAGSGFAITQTSKHKDDAWIAIQEMTSPEAERYLVSQNRAFPARTAQQGDWYSKTGAGVENAREAMEYSLQHSVPYGVAPNISTFNALCEQYFPLAFSGSQSASDVLSSIQGQL
ncbi:carbohydrate ABC transporter substrate-binding protein, CUT1 family [Faunimonas pinastri]|uniref:Carbohydrate ABC transporter substrate-binding protein, CUT1 family n=1 Tax=Faunimonas pinastri TaxID=1855383 RepID=A0A1H9QUK1_9HYPH|nr:sugar ABC transporter substrate-binding protein [Faunimonas pinastri]SER63529.1 carbohydrate ABC transporter substrate-binding protein, CUT1 family [Faunimonas pinastri]